MFDLAIIGAGYNGSAVAHHARAAGLGFLHFDTGDGSAGSRAAAAIIDCNALVAGHPELDIEGSLEWLRSQGAVEDRFYFINAMLGAKRPVRQLKRPCLFVPPRVLLSEHVISERVTSFRRAGAGWEIVTDQDCFSAKNLVVAAGYSTDQVLRASGFSPLGVKPAFGRGWVVSGKPRFNLPVAVMTAPYKKFFVRSWDDGDYYVGATVEAHPDPERADAQLSWVSDMVFSDYEVKAVRAGYRAKYRGELLVNCGPLVITGGGRAGLGTAYAVGKLVVEIITGVAVDSQGTRAG